MHVSNEAILKQRELNRRHTEATGDNKKSKGIKPQTDEECANIVALWLENNVPSVRIEDEKVITHQEQKISIPESLS